MKTLPKVLTRPRAKKIKYPMLRKQKKPVNICPKCGQGEIIADSRGYYCSNLCGHEMII